MSRRRRGRTPVTPTIPPNDGSPLGHLSDADLMKELARRRLGQGPVDVGAIERFAEDAQRDLGHETLLQAIDALAPEDGSPKPCPRCGRPVPVKARNRPRHLLLGLRPGLEEGDIEEEGHGGSRLSHLFEGDLDLRAGARVQKRAVADEVVRALHPEPCCGDERVNERGAGLLGHRVQGWVVRVGAELQQVTHQITSQSLNRGRQQGVTEVVTRGAPVAELLQPRSESGLVLQRVQQLSEVHGCDPSSGGSDAAPRRARGVSRPHAKLRGRVMRLTQDLAPEPGAVVFR